MAGKIAKRMQGVLRSKVGKAPAPPKGRPAMPPGAPKGKAAAPKGKR